MKNKIKLIKNLYEKISSDNLIINLINTNKYIDNCKINSIQQKNYLNFVIIYILQKFCKNIKEIIFNYCCIKNNLKYLIKFIKLLFIYFVEKYYYKSTSIDFIIKVISNIDSFDFFITLNKLKKFLNFTKKQDKPFVRLIYYYTLTIMYCIALGPISWFLLRVVTDRMNWMIYVFEHTNMSLLL